MLLIQETSHSKAEEDDIQTPKEITYKLRINSRYCRIIILVHRDTGVEEEDDEEEAMNESHSEVVLIILTTTRTMKKKLMMMIIFISRDFIRIRT